MRLEEETERSTDLDREELQRVRTEYVRRDADRELSMRYAPTNPAVLLWQHDLERRLARLLTAGGVLPLVGRQVLDVGCGSGGLLRLLQELGGSARALVGIDIGADRLATARRLAPHHWFVLANGESVPFADCAFDLVCQSGLFTSLLDADVRVEAAREMVRVLRPGGRILWHDFIWNPTNRATRGIGEREVRALFPGFSARVERAILAPPLARFVAPRSHVMATALSSVPWLNSYCLALLWREP